jgi:transposase
MQLPLYVNILRKDVRLLNIHNQQLQRSHQLQKNKSDKLEEENHSLRKENIVLKKEKQKLEEELEKVKRERDSYKGLVFKEKRVCSNPSSHKNSGKKRGGQIGHTGISRKKPEVVDHHIHAHLTNCPHCGNPLETTASVATHTVVDVPHWSLMKQIATEYTIERQWCRNCHKEVRAVPFGVIPHSRLGVNLFTMVMVWHYRMRLPFNKIAENLTIFYGIAVSEGALVLMLERAKEWLGEQYDKLVDRIRAAPVKHADETSWPVGPDNWWAWVFTTKKETVYTIEETRGGGVAKNMLATAIGILVRDDYAAYAALSLLQQSCWAHLLRKSHEAAKREEAPDEVKKLHKKLTDLFLLLSEDCLQPFDKKQREELHRWYTDDLEKIMATEYTATDAKRIQTRIRNQGTNLLTALLFPDVPLTNNLAERAVMPLVITRKISRGSKTPNGAKTHAVNMSIVETIHKQKLPLLDTLRSYLLKTTAV